MKLNINGQTHNISGISYISDLVDNLKLDISKLAIECNLELIPKSLYESTPLKENDNLEIVGFIGGG